MHLGRDKKVWIIRRTVPRAAVLAALNHQPGLHAALVARIAQIPFLAAAYTKAAAELKADDNPKVRAWDRARATWAKAQAAWAAQNPVEDDRARAAKAETTLLAQNPGWAQMPWAKAVVAYDKARATWDKAHAPYDKAKAAYEKAQGRYHKALKIQFILAHLPPWIGTISAIKTIRTVSGLCGRSGYVARNSIMNGAIAGKTKADFKGRYHFSDIQAGQYFFILPSSGALTYGHLVALTYRHLVVDYGHPIMVAGGKNIRVDIDLNSAQPIIVRSAI